MRKDIFVRHPKTMNASRFGNNLSWASELGTTGNSRCCDSDLGLDEVYTKYNVLQKQQQGFNLEPLAGKGMPPMGLSK